MRFVWIVLVLVVAGASNARGDDEAPTWTFGSAKANDAVRQFRTSRKKLDEAYERRRKENRTALISQMQENVKAATKANDLDDAVAIREAIKVFSREPAAGDAPDFTARQEPDEGKGPEEGAFAAPDGAVPFSKHYYKYIPTLMSPQNAAAECARLGGHLVRIESKAEHRFVVNLIQRSGNKHDWVMIDGSDAGHEGAWTFSNGKPMRYFAWSPGHPHIAPERNHLILDFRFGATYGDCMASVDRPPFVCEWDENDLKALAGNVEDDAKDPKGKKGKGRK